MSLASWPASLASTSSSLRDRLEELDMRAPMQSRLAPLWAKEVAMALPTRWDAPLMKTVCPDRREDGNLLGRWQGMCINGVTQLGNIIQQYVHVHLGLLPPMRSKTYVSKIVVPYSPSFRDTWHHLFLSVVLMRAALLPDGISCPSAPSGCGLKQSSSSRAHPPDPQAARA